MKKFTLYIPLIAGILCIFLGVFVLLYTFGVHEPSLTAGALGILVWVGCILSATYLIGEFIRDIKWINYYEGYEDCKNELRHGPLKEMYEQWLKQLDK